MPTALQNRIQESGLAVRPGVPVRAVGEAQRREVVLISAGWGSSGYYSEEVLSRDIPAIFPVGTHMYLDHPTAQENAERPERSTLDLVGKIVETPRMAGIEAVAVVEIYPHWVPIIEAMKDDIGLSIRAMGVADEGDAGGKRGMVIEKLTEGISVDYVTKAGAGGRIGELVESARDQNDKLLGGHPLSEKTGPGSGDRTHEEDAMSDAKLAELETRIREAEERASKAETAATEAKTAAAEEKAKRERAEEALLTQEAKRFVAKEAAGAEGLPKKAKARVIESVLAKDIPLDANGKVNTAALKESVESAVKDEKEYLSEIGGGVSGFGVSESDVEGAGELGLGFGLSESERKVEESADSLLEEAMTGLTGDEAVAKHAAGGR
jgi:hypothetical protein